MAHSPQYLALYRQLTSARSSQRTTAHTERPRRLPQAPGAHGWANQTPAGLSTLSAHASSPVT
jgi:hypothetical protein